MKYKSHTNKFVHQANLTIDPLNFQYLPRHLYIKRPRLHNGIPQRAEFRKQGIHNPRDSNVGWNFWHTPGARNLGWWGVWVDARALGAHGRRVGVGRESNHV